MATAPAAAGPAAARPASFAVERRRLRHGFALVGLRCRRRFPELRQSGLKIGGRCRFGRPCHLLARLPARAPRIACSGFRRFLDCRAVQGGLRRFRRGLLRRCQRRSRRDSGKPALDLPANVFRRQPRVERGFFQQGDGQRRRTTKLGKVRGGREQEPVPVARSAPSRMKSSVERFKVGEPLPAARRAAFASPSLATRATAACQSAAAVFAGPGHVRHGRTVPASWRVPRIAASGPSQFVERQPALVQGRSSGAESSGAEGPHLVIHPGVNRHGGQFGDVFGEAPRRPVEVGRRRRRPERVGSPR